MDRKVARRWVLGTLVVGDLLMALVLLLSVMATSHDNGILEADDDCVEAWLVAEEIVTVTKWDVEVTEKRWIDDEHAQFLMRFEGEHLGQDEDIERWIDCRAHAAGGDESGMIVDRVRLLEEAP